MVALFVQAVITALPFIVMFVVPGYAVAFSAVFLWRRTYSFWHPYAPELPPGEALKVADRSYWGTVAAVGLLLLFHALSPSPSAAATSKAQSPFARPQSVPCHVVAVQMPSGQPQRIVYGPPGCQPQ